MLRQYTRSITHGSLAGSLTAIISFAYAWHRPLFPSPFGRPLDWPVFGLSPLTLLGYTAMPHKPEFVTIYLLMAFVIVVNSLLYAAIFTGIYAIRRLAQKNRTNIEVANGI